MNVRHLTSRVLIMLLLSGWRPDAGAARVQDLYSAQVRTSTGESLSEAEIFDRALAAVLVKVTGRRGIMAEPVVRSRFADAGRYVQQHRTNPDGGTWVLFDRVALREALDETDQPVWGEERPATLTWLVIDDGEGTRNILPAAADTERRRGLFAAEAPADNLKRQMAVREILRITADERGLPLVLPLVDSDELELLSISDIWGGFNESLILASQRYGADAILIGRARAGFVEFAQVRWTLLLDDERFDWEGGIASGPDRIADFFAQRFATSGKAMGRLILRVDGVGSLGDYGRLSRYLASLDVIEDFAVARVEDRSMLFTLNVRGDADRLMRSIALRRVLQPALPADSPRDPIAGADSPSSLHYTLIAGP